VSARHIWWVNDSIQAPILTLDNFLGLHVNDQYQFQPNGLYVPSSEWDITLGFDNGNTRTGTPLSSIRFGADGNAKIYRGDDGFGDNEFIIYVDGKTLILNMVAGLFPSNPINLGTTLNRWATAFFQSLTLSNPLTQGNGGTGQTSLAALTRSALGVPTGPVSWGGFKIQNLADGAAAGEAATFGQTQSGAWVAVSTFTNSWASGTAGGQAAVSYRLTADKQHVELAGSLITGTAGNAAFTLPAGFRPISTKVLSSYSGGSSAGREISISTGGVVTPVGGTQPFSLDGLMFPLDI
jgi:hypothetical protein